MMRLPLACPKCGRTETDEPVGVSLTAGLQATHFRGLDPYHCAGCWDVVTGSACALPQAYTARNVAALTCGFELGIRKNRPHHPLPRRPQLPVQPRAGVSAITTHLVVRAEGLS